MYIPTKTQNVPTYKYYPLRSGYKEEDWGMGEFLDQQYTFCKIQIYGVAHRHLKSGQLFIVYVYCISFLKLKAHI